MDPKELFKHQHSFEMYDKLCALCPDEGTKSYWKWFLALSEIPRQSGNREGPSKWLINITEKNEFAIQTTKGLEDKPSICIQGHYDMVGTLAAGVVHDFSKDPIKMQLDDNILSACGTTLGGDDGTGVACGLVYMEQRDSFKHPAFEIMFTADEEIGCIGASALVPGELLTKNCKYVINVDSEEWGELTISSSGTAFRVGKVPVTYETSKSGLSKVNIIIEKFKGGHSGAEIHHQRANALKWIVQLVLQAKSLLRINGNHYHIIDFEAGHAHNAIPSHANITLAVPTAIVEQLKQEITTNHKALTSLFMGIEESEPTLKITSSELAEGTKMLDYTSTCNCFQIVDKLPHGVTKFSKDVDDLVETSQSVAIGKLDGDFFNITVFARSSIEEDMFALIEADEKIFKCHRAEFTKPIEDASGWPADPTSHIVSVVKQSYKDLFKTDIKTVAIHAGLENAIIMAKYKDLNLQSVSLGPSVHDVHTPKEHIHVDTANKLYALLVKVIENL
ncbi:Aminoacyl-histidine dipeptidase [Entamoeba marina]